MSVNASVIMWQTYHYCHDFPGNAWVSYLGHLPLGRILIGRWWAIHVPNLRHLQWSFQLSLLYFLGSPGYQLSSLLSLGWLPWQRSSLEGVEWNMSPTLGTSSGLSSSYKRIISPPVHRPCIHYYSDTLIWLILLLPGFLFPWILLF